MVHLGRRDELSERWALSSEQLTRACAWVRAYRPWLYTLNLWRRTHVSCEMQEILRDQIWHWIQYPTSTAKSFVFTSIGEAIDTCSLSWYLQHCKRNDKSEALRRCAAGPLTNLLYQWGQLNSSTGHSSLAFPKPTFYLLHSGVDHSYKIRST